MAVGTDKKPCGHDREGLTYEAKDVADGRHKDDKQIDQENEAKRNADVNHPAEWLVREKDLEQGPADLQREGRRGGHLEWWSHQEAMFVWSSTESNREKISRHKLKVSTKQICKIV